MSMLFFQLKLIERLSRGNAIQWIPPVACKGLKIHSTLPLLLSGFLSPTLQAYATWLRLILQAPNVLNLQAFAHAVPSTCNATPVFACPQLNILHGSGCVTSFFFFPIWPRCATYGILISWAGFEPQPLQWACGVLITGLPGSPLVISSVKDFPTPKGRPMLPLLRILGLHPMARSILGPT